MHSIPHQSNHLHSALPQSSWWTIGKCHESEYSHTFFHTFLVHNLDRITQDNPSQTPLGLLSFECHHRRLLEYCCSGCTSSTSCSWPWPFWIDWTEMEVRNSTAPFTAAWWKQVQNHSSRSPFSPSSPHKFREKGEYTAMPMPILTISSTSISCMPCLAHWLYIPSWHSLYTIVSSCMWTLPVPQLHWKVSPGMRPWHPIANGGSGDWFGEIPFSELWLLLLLQWRYCCWKNCEECCRRPDLKMYGMSIAISATDTSKSCSWIWVGMILLNGILYVYCTCTVLYLDFFASEQLNLLRTRRSVEMHHYGEEFPNMTLLARCVINAFQKQVYGLFGGSPRKTQCPRDLYWRKK